MQNRLTIEQANQPCEMPAQWFQGKYYPPSVEIVPWLDTDRCYESGEVQVKLDPILNDTKNVWFSTRCFHLGPEGRQDALMMIVHTEDGPSYRINAEGVEFVRIVRGLTEERSSFLEMSEEGRKIFRRTSSNLQASMLSLAQTWSLSMDELLKHVT